MGNHAAGFVNDYLTAVFNASEVAYEMLTVGSQVIFANHFNDGNLEPKGFVVILESEAI